MCGVSGSASTTVDCRRLIVRCFRLLLLNADWRELMRSHSCCGAQHTTTLSCWSERRRDSLLTARAHPAERHEIFRLRGDCMHAVALGWRLLGVVATMFAIAHLIIFRLTLLDSPYLKLQVRTWVSPLVASALPSSPHLSSRRSKQSPSGCFARDLVPSKSISNVQVKSETLSRTSIKRLSSCADVDWTLTWTASSGH